MMDVCTSPRCGDGCDLNVGCGWTCQRRDKTLNCLATRSRKTESCKEEMKKTWKPGLTLVGQQLEQPQLFQVARGRKALTPAVVTGPESRGGSTSVLPMMDTNVPAVLSKSQ